MVPPAGPGVFTVKSAGAETFKLVVAGHTFTSRAAIEKYLAWRAARLTIEQGGQWFTFKEIRGKEETAVPLPARDPEGRRSLNEPGPRRRRALASSGTPWRRSRSHLRRSCSRAGIGFCSERSCASVAPGEDVGRSE